MKQYRFCLISLFLAMFLGACMDSPAEPESEKPDGTVYSESFVWTYVVPQNISGEMPNNRYIYLRFDGKEISRQSEESTYDKLCVKNNDLSYNNKIVPNSTRALGREYSGINVVCDKDIDPAHKAGTPLNDRIKICAMSFKNFIASGYDASFRAPASPVEFSGLNLYNGPGGTPLFKLLSELDKDDLMVVEPEIYLYFMEALAPGRYTFTITLKSEDGETTCTVTATV